jgi:alkylation response protein AidB-like acyl-CoA dehydrogenase
MDFRFSDEQVMVADTLRGLLEEHCTSADLRRQMKAGGAPDAARWARIAGLGVQMALVPEDRGGLGLGPADFVLLAEACGAACLPEPLVESAGVALPVLAAILPDDPLTEAALAGEITVALAHPLNPFVADADSAGVILLPDPGGFRLLAPAEAALERQPSVDPFRRLFAVAGAGRRVAAPDAPALLEAAGLRGALFAAAQMLGIAERATRLAVDYASGREQFGRPIGSYQAVKHMLAEAQVKTEFARPVVYAAAAELGAGAPNAAARVAHAFLAAAAAADRATRSSVQAHGAMGYSWEVDVHLYLKRALALSGTWGGLRLHRARAAERALAAPLGPDHTFAGARNA